MSAVSGSVIDAVYVKSDFALPFPFSKEIYYTIQPSFQRFQRRPLHQSKLSNPIDFVWFLFHNVTVYAFNYSLDMVLYQSRWLKVIYQKERKLW